MTTKPTQTMREFFERPDVRALQEAQKRNPYGSQPHRDAYFQMCRLAAEIGAGEFLNPEDY